MATTSRGVKPKEPTFRYAGNKKQYELNNSVVEKLQVAAATDDHKHRMAAIEEGKSLLPDRNRHILLAERYGWDMVEHYVEKPLATDPDDENRIKRAVKEMGQRGREEKKKKIAPPTRLKRPVTGLTLRKMSKEWLTERLMARHEDIREKQGVT